MDLNVVDYVAQTSTATATYVYDKKHPLGINLRGITISNTSSINVLTLNINNMPIVVRPDEQFSANFVNWHTFSVNSIGTWRAVISK